VTQYDPAKHHRRSIRLPGYDYTSPGAYFVTICVRHGECLLGEVVDGVMRLSDWGRVVQHYWQRIPIHFPHAELDRWVVMPNHLHGVLVMVRRGEASLSDPSPSQSLPSKARAPSEEPRAGDASPLLRPGSLGATIGNFKSVTTRRINRMRKTPGIPFWHRNYWEHIIRNEASLNRIREYIDTNPARWTEDQLHPEAAPNPFNRWPSE
jgi:REP element-mobilizing transposase RayT